MSILEFPPVEKANIDGLLALGGDLELSSLILAYSKGIFPWPISKQYPLAWFSPNPRGLLKFDNLHVGRTLKKIIRKNDFEIKFNTSFDHVIDQCATILRRDQSDTWITSDIINAYKKLFLNDLAYCVEVWRENKIIAGVYGVCINNNFCGESMFSYKDNMSKIALLALMSVLKKNNITYLDTQMITDVVKYLGGKYVTRSEFLTKYLDNSKNNHIKNYSREQIFSVQPCLDLFLTNSK